MTKNRPQNSIALNVTIVSFYDAVFSYIPKQNTLFSIAHTTAVNIETRNARLYTTKNWMRMFAHYIQFRQIPITILTFFCNSSRTWITRFVFSSIRLVAPSYGAARFPMSLGVDEIFRWRAASSISVIEIFAYGHTDLHAHTHTEALDLGFYI